MMRIPSSAVRALLALAIPGVMMLGCTDSQDELQQWMDQQAREVKPNVSPLSAPKKFDPQPYLAAAAVEPFSQQKLAVALRQADKAANPLLTVELSRRKEPLEAYPIDSMAMVGSVATKGRPQALLRVDKLLYQVKVGNYIGQNYGKILSITETEVTYREVVQDATGDPTERIGTLQLQEKAR